VRKKSAFGYPVHTGEQAILSSDIERTGIKTEGHKIYVIVAEKFEISADVDASPLGLFFPLCSQPHPDPVAMESGF
jgi:hypothetical protein